MLLEPNNLIGEATPSGVDFSLKNSVTVSDRIDSLEDVDLYHFQLNKGQGIIFDVTSATNEAGEVNFDSFLRIFDRDGNELATYDDTPSTVSPEFSLDAYGGFIANRTNDYYVGISSTGNQSYDPINGSEVNLAAGQFSGGDYDLTFSLVDVVADKDPDNTISEAIATEINPKTQRAAVKGKINAVNDVDFYRFELPKASGVNIDLQAVGEDSQLDSYLRLFDRQGREVAVNDDHNTGEQITLDSAIAFAPDQPETYFVGVSSSGHFKYDPLNGDTNLNFDTNTGVTTGDYQLKLEIEPIVVDQDPDNTLIEAQIVAPNSSKLLSGEIDSELDVDVFQFRVDVAEGIKLDLKTDGNSELNSYLRLFDSQGNELVVGDRNLSLIPEAPGLYYAAVSSSGNEDYDPLAGRNNFDGSENNPTLTTGKYKLEIDVAPVRADTDPDNTLVEAIASGINSSQTKEAVLKGKIDSPEDIDIYWVNLHEGEGITAELDTTDRDSELDSYLRLFDSQGNELAFNNDQDNSLNNLDTDSLLTFVPETTGMYFVGVSSDGNFNYNAVAGRNNFTPPSQGFSEGKYTLNLNLSEVITDDDNDNTLAEAIAFNPDFSNIPMTISNSIDFPADVDLYVVELDLGSTVSFDLDTQSETRLDTLLRVFDAEGNELAYNDDATAPEEFYSLDSYLEFTAPTSGTYYVGVSSYGNLDYDPVDGSNNFTEDASSTTTGDYELTVDLTKIVNSIEGTAADERLEGTEEIDAISGLAGKDTLVGAAEDDNLIGGNGNDSLFGNQGDDVLQGGSGNDMLFGGEGDDILDGGRGRDRLWGKSGEDIFVIAADSDVTNIIDFEVGIDQIALIGGIGYEDLSFANTQNGVGMSLDNQVIGTIFDLEVSQISAADFIVET